ncbi:MAG: hypothetical protein Q8O98_00845 [bacterium]|nr:hypothetical protein [bacterium]
MNYYDKSKIGRRIAIGGEHIVYEYVEDQVIKFSGLFFLLGKKAKEKAISDAVVCKEFFGKYFLDTQIAVSPNNKWIVHIQQKIIGRPLEIGDLEDERLRLQFKEIIECHLFMRKAGYADLDFIGREGVFGKRLGNIFVTDNGSLLIIDATILSASGIISPYVALIRRYIVWRQENIFRSFS